MASVHATQSSDTTQWPISSCESDAERYSPFMSIGSFNPASVLR